MAEATADAAAPAPAPRSGLVGALANAGGMFAASLMAVIAGGYINASLHQPPEYVLNEKDGRITVYVPPPPKEAKGKEKDKVAQPALFYSMDPPLVVNFEDSSAVRFLQIGVDMMTRDPLTIEAAQKHSPLIRNNLLLVISNRDYQKLMTREGKEELRASPHGSGQG